MWFSVFPDRRQCHGRHADIQTNNEIKFIHTTKLILPVVLNPNTDESAPENHRRMRNAERVITQF
jgi:hypothetical protein